MTDRGIIMIGPMVKALLDGKKTQTRRLAWRPKKPKERYAPGDLLVSYGDKPVRKGESFKPTVWQKAQPGDRLWVRETWVQGWPTNDGGDIQDTDEHGNDLPMKIWYRADGDLDVWINRDNDEKQNVPWRPSIHMPRWASRLTLIVTEVRRQRLQEISEEDALAEGIYRQDPSTEEIAAGDCTEDDFVFLAPGTRQGYGPRPDDPQWGPTAAFAYRCLWDSLHGKGTWERNEEVVVLSFRCLKENIDQR